MYEWDFAGASQPTLDAFDRAPILSTDQKRDLILPQCRDVLSATDAASGPNNCDYRVRCS
jgi:hypothetical protein